MTGLPDGFVDPTDVDQVAAVLDAVHADSGPSGLFDLLGRLPGVRLDPGVAKGFLRAAVPASLWVGGENQLQLADAPRPGGTLVLHHVVGGVVLSRESLAPGRTAATLAPLVVAAVRDVRGGDDASATLSAHRDLYGRP